ncbi:cutinase [Isoptericola sp. CG 20/1183]|uniref:Cutinase n=1 Tax=Isoptericola halotolerans TaxID=300560 RepID=A0ABX5E997_9MICO|nr:MULTISPECIES: dienelactone hydrolase family protein [Isoptericola]PRZ02635.1 cutinase [Isoptericola sp. CG 20/1183]PRZ02987.1 cutinase [Isoptericola halotolerans]
MQHSISTSKTRQRVTAVLASLAVAVGVGIAAGPAAHGADNPHERGPDPTESSIEALRGSYAVSERSVSRWVSGFGGGTIYYPTTTSDGDFGAVVISPGYTGTESTVAWLGPRLASQGFVVLTMATNSIYDQPDSRARQLQAALDYLTASSPVADRIDADRLALMGHSMGGGGTLRAVDDNPDIKAAIPMTPWHPQKDWSSVSTPTLIFAAENDSVARHETHAEPFYESFEQDLPKAYLELDGASHFAPNTSNTTIAKYSISWLKRFVDDDTRYTPFLCPGPSTGWLSDVEKYESSCPF